jgi:hypothetical protein
MIQQVNGHLIVEPGRTSAAEVADIYRQIATLCVEKQVRRVLIKLREHDAASERALRVALTTMVLAGLPAEFRLALVAESDRIAARFRNTERDLCAAGIDAKIFEAEDGATRWLNEK